MNVSRAVATLKETGRIRSEPDENNHRRQLLYLTDDGEALFQELFPIARRQAEDLFDIFSPEEHEQFSVLLQRLLDRAEAAIGDD